MEQASEQGVKTGKPGIQICVGCAVPHTVATMLVSNLRRGNASRVIRGDGVFRYVSCVHNLRFHLFKIHVKQRWSIEFIFRPLTITHAESMILRTQFDTPSLTPHFDSLIRNRHYAAERIQNHITWIAKSLDQSFDDIELQRANMVLGRFATQVGVQCFDSEQCPSTRPNCSNMAQTASLTLGSVHASRRPQCIGHMRSDNRTNDLCSNLATSDICRMLTLWRPVLDSSAHCRSIARYRRSVNLPPCS
jgi:hypothetical protein